MHKYVNRERGCEWDSVCVCVRVCVCVCACVCVRERDRYRSSECVIERVIICVSETMCMREWVSVCVGERNRVKNDITMLSASNSRDTRLDT